MTKISNDMIWFCNQIKQAEAILAEAIGRTEQFSITDKNMIKKIMPEVESIDLALLQLLSPTKPPQQTVL